MSIICRLSRPLCSHKELFLFLPQFKAIYADDQSQASVGIDAALTMRNVDHVVAFLGPLQSSVSEPVAQVISNFKVCCPKPH